MSEPEKKGTMLEHAIAQTEAEIAKIDDECTTLQKNAKALRIKQDELRTMLARLLVPVVAEEETPSL